MMETTEILKAWKKFGRPQVLVDRNMKRVWNIDPTDAIEEGLDLLSGWFQKRQSQQVLVIVFMLSVFPLSLGEQFSTLFLGMDIWESILLLCPLCLVLSVWVMPLWAVVMLFPFKWSLLSEKQAERVSRDLYGIIVLFLTSCMVTPLVLPVTANSVAFSILMFVLYLELGRVNLDIMALNNVER